ncbi:hypothetical protein HPP92_003894 [Vanilla planifolia]|uniref:Glutaredoxin domain-containing protein n=1 Tax=Vanilla planifolia TaxID=51239 RepID=A0A835S8E8_VANPL|nr:hypothetical protein HPP92_003894 [Vanilla planifolia]
MSHGSPLPRTTSRSPPRPSPLLEKLDSFEIAPKPWSEVSKALEDLKPSFNLSLDEEKPSFNPSSRPNTLIKDPTFDVVHGEVHETKSTTFELSSSSSPRRPPPPELTGLRTVRENNFVLRDRQERQGKKGEEQRKWKRRDPFEGYPERRPPGNPDGVVLYTTTLRGVRRTFEDCERVRQVMEGRAAEAGLEVDERDVALHGDYLREVRELAGEGATVPRVFVGGRYIGGAAEVVEVDETGKLGEMMRWLGRRNGGGEKGKRGRRDCEGCGGARFVPCLVCGGSCKVASEDAQGFKRCGSCNENGLVMCPLCH